jgi:hypothetical protein
LPRYRGYCSKTGNRHAPCSGIHAKDAAKYPRGLCRAILQGVTQQLRSDEVIKDGCYGIQAPDDEASIRRNVLGPSQGYSGKYRDDLTGQPLKDIEVQRARAVELQYFHAKGVWTKVPRSRSQKDTGRNPITVRWVDVNKGDEQNPNYRSRLVARQLKATDRSGQTYFAPAPPLEALRTVISFAMTRIGEHVPDWNPLSSKRTQISFVDVRRAYFNAKVDQDEAPVYVDLPPEDEDSGTMCARLLRHMYGARRAADGWQE